MKYAVVPERRATEESPLSAQERKVLYLQWEGLQRKEIAEVLGLTPKTVHNYTCSLYRKLGVHSAMQAVRVGLARGWLTLERRRAR